jgi:hypothetical protein
MKHYPQLNKRLYRKSDNLCAEITKVSYRDDQVTMHCPTNARPVFDDFSITINEYENEWSEFKNDEIEHPRQKSINGYYPISLRNLEYSEIPTSDEVVAFATFQALMRRHDVSRILRKKNRK